MVFRKLLDTAKWTSFSLLEDILDEYTTPVVATRSTVDKYTRYEKRFESGSVFF